MSLSKTIPEQTHAPRRAASRLRLHLPAKITLLDGNCSCLIENISTTGAQLLVENPPQLGEYGQIVCEHVTTFFTTVWCAGNIVGVEFDETLPSDKMLQLRQINDSYSALQKQAARRTARRWVAGDLN